MRHAIMAAALLTAGLGLAGCASEYGYGGGVAAGYGYPDGYGYGGGGYDAGYADYYDGAYGSPYWGWYGDYYYPGSGIYVYDRYRRPVRWNGAQQRYWQGRLNGWRGRRGGPEWRGVDRQGGYAGGYGRSGGNPNQGPRAPGRGIGERSFGTVGGREGPGRFRPTGVPGATVPTGGVPGGAAPFGNAPVGGRGPFGPRGGAAPFARPGPVGVRPQGARQAPAEGRAPRSGEHGGGHPDGPR